MLYPAIRGRSLVRPPTTGVLLAIRLGPGNGSRRSAMKTLLSALTGRRARHTRDSSAPAPAAPALPRGLAALREQVLEHGLSRERAQALADALEDDGRLYEAI